MQESSTDSYFSLPNQLDQCRQFWFRSALDLGPPVFPFLSIFAHPLAHSAEFAAFSRLPLPPLPRTHHRGDLPFPSTTVEISESTYIEFERPSSTSPPSPLSRTPSVLLRRRSISSLIRQSLLSFASSVDDLSKTKTKKESVRRCLFLFFSFAPRFSPLPLPPKPLSSTKLVQLYSLRNPSQPS